MLPALVLFSGHNQRAIVALCRFLDSADQPFFIVSSDSDDAILHTHWRNHVLVQRTSKELDIVLMARIQLQIAKLGYTAALCPTSEFLNQFALENETILRAQGWKWILPPQPIYFSLTEKSLSPSVVRSLIGLEQPKLQLPNEWHAPCVLKPVRNVQEGRTLYPLLCPTASDLSMATKAVDSERWFAQEWVEGQSFYLCAYLDQLGEWDAFWQENLLQQPNGKSMVLARSCSNPGIDTHRLMSGLHKLGYRGPLMLELIQDQAGLHHFIEINPRFWGPLELTRRAHPAILYRFLADLNGRRLPPSTQDAHPGVMYAWSFGAQQSPLRTYPAAKPIPPDQLARLLSEHDVYASSDTNALYNQH